jgi:hypothetical protein
VHRTSPFVADSLAFPQSWAHGNFAARSTEHFRAEYVRARNHQMGDAAKAVGRAFLSDPERQECLSCAVLLQNSSISLIYSRVKFAAHIKTYLFSVIRKP